MFRDLSVKKRHLCCVLDATLRCGIGRENFEMNTRITIGSRTIEDQLLLTLYKLLATDLAVKYRPKEEGLDLKTEGRSRKLFHVFSNARSNHYL